MKNLLKGFLLAIVLMIVVSAGVATTQTVFQPKQPKQTKIVFCRMQDITSVMPRNLEDGWIVDKMTHAAAGGTSVEHHWVTFVLVKY